MRKIVQEGTVEEEMVKEQLCVLCENFSSVLNTCALFAIAFFDLYGNPK